MKALESPKMRFRLRPGGGDDSVMVLKKVSQEGLEMVLGKPKARATATITYKSESSCVTFVVKRSRIFGSLTTAGGRRVYLKPCTQEGPEMCHMIISGVNDIS